MFRLCNYNIILHLYGACQKAVGNASPGKYAIDAFFNYPCACILIKIGEGGNRKVNFHGLALTGKQHPCLSKSCKLSVLFRRPILGRTDIYLHHFFSAVDFSLIGHHRFHGYSGLGRAKVLLPDACRLQIKGGVRQSEAKPIPERNIIGIKIPVSHINTLMILLMLCVPVIVGKGLCIGIMIIIVCPCVCHFTGGRDGTADNICHRVPAFHARLLYIQNPFNFLIFIGKVHIHDPAGI